MDEKAAPESGVAIPLEYQVPASVGLEVAHELTVLHTDEEFIVQFFRTEVPALAGNAEERRAQLEALDRVVTRCVARLQITPKRFKRIVKALSDNLAGYEKRFGEIQDEPQ